MAVARFGALAQRGHVLTGRCDRDHVLARMEHVHLGGSIPADVELVVAGLVDDDSQRIREPRPEAGARPVETPALAAADDGVLAGGGRLGGACFHLCDRGRFRFGDAAIERARGPLRLLLEWRARAAERGQQHELQGAHACRIPISRVR